MAEPLPKEKRKELFDMFDSRGPDGKPSLEEIAAAANVSLGSVHSYHKRWQEKRREEEKVKNNVVQQSPLDLLEDFLKKAPGVNEGGVEWCMTQLSLKEDSGQALNPGEVYQLILESTKVRPFFAQEAVKVAFGPSTTAAPFLGPYGTPQAT